MLSVCRRGLRISTGALRWSWSVAPCRRRSADATAAAIKRIMLASCLLMLKCRCPGLDESVLDTASDFSRKHGSRIQRARDWFFPCLQHFVQLSACLGVDERVDVHKRLVKVPAHEQGVRSPYVLDDRVHYIERRQLLHWGSLQTEALDTDRTKVATDFIPETFSYENGVR